MELILLLNPGCRQFIKAYCLIADVCFHSLYLLTFIFLAFLEHQFLVQIAHVPAKSKLASGPARLHLLDYMFCLTAGVPPKLLGIWPLRELRRFGVVDGKFCFEGGSRCGKGSNKCKIQ